MKKLFTFLGALLLWQAMAVAQNYLHVYHGDTCVTEIPIANLDSATVRDKYYYGYDWEYVGIGTYTFSLITDWVISDPVYKRQVNKDMVLWQFKLDNWLFDNYGIIIDYDASTGRCHVQPQPTGWDHPTYGMVMATDVATYTGNENYVSTYNEETGVFELYMIYYVDLGSFDSGYEYLQLDVETPTRIREHKGLLSDTLNKLPKHTLRKALPSEQQIPSIQRATSTEKAPQQLMMCPVDQTIK